MSSKIINLLRVIRAGLPHMIGKVGKITSRLPKTWVDWLTKTRPSNFKPVALRPRRIAFRNFAARLTPQLRNFTAGTLRHRELLHIDAPRTNSIFVHNMVAEKSSRLFDSVKEMVSVDELESEDDQKLYPRSLDGYDIGDYIAPGCNSIVYRACESLEPSITKPSGFDLPLRTKSSEEMKRFPLAIKIMFNFDCPTDERTLFKEMGQELVPIFDKRVAKPKLLKSITKFNPHVVRIYTAFVDELRMFREIDMIAPAILPLELSPHGIGQTHTMYLVMKRYKQTLRQYHLNHGGSFLSEDDVSAPSQSDTVVRVPPRTRHLLVAQLLEAVRFLKEQKIVHRDLKSNNILLNFDFDGQVPHLVVADFGCALANGSFQVLFADESTDLGGNYALRPPEISTAKPAWNKFVDFSSSDLWAAGTVIYEILTDSHSNPFYNTKKFQSTTYKAELLPSLPDHVSNSLKKLTLNIMQRDVKKRPSAECAANVSILSLFSLKTIWNQLYGEANQKTAATYYLKVNNLFALFAAESFLTKSSDNFSDVEYRLRLMLLNRFDLAHFLDTLPYFAEAKQAV